MNAEKTIGHAITESVMQNRIVHLPYSKELEGELDALCDGATDCQGGCDYRGSDDGHDWRIILDLP